MGSLPFFHWDLNDTGSIAKDLGGQADGEIVAATSAFDANKSKNVITFDGTDDYINFGDIDEMDQVDRFTYSIWFKRTSDISSAPTNHGVHNVLLAQSSSASNDNLEIGTNGTIVQLYIDSGSAETDDTVTFDAGLVNNRWYHLAVVYGSELSLFLDGTKLSTWTQYNGRLESSQTSLFRLEWPGQTQVAGVRSRVVYPMPGSTFRNFRMRRSEFSQVVVQSKHLPLVTQSCPIVSVSPATGITDSNATLNYELVSFDGPQPEIIFYWGKFDQMYNEGLWENSQSLGAEELDSVLLRLEDTPPGTRFSFKSGQRDNLLRIGPTSPVNLRRFPCLQFPLFLQPLKQAQVLHLMVRLRGMAGSRLPWHWILRLFPMACLGTGALMKDREVRLMIRPVFLQPQRFSVASLGRKEWAVHSTPLLSLTEVLFPM